MRKLAFFASAFGAAVLLCCYFAPLSWLAALGLGCALGGALLWLALGTRAKAFVLLLAGLGAGFLWFRGWTDLRLAPVEELAGTTGPIRAVVVDWPVPADYGQRVEVRLAGVPALLYTKGDGGGLRPGDEILVTAALKRADVRREERTRVFTSRGYFLLAYARDEVEVTRRPAHTPVWLLPRVWNRALTRSIQAVFPEDAAGLVSAVLLGDRSGLRDADSSALSRAGLAHAAAVSGLHIGILAQLVMLLCRQRRRLAAGLTIPVLILFVLLTGTRPGAVRAAVMQTVLLLAPLLKREDDGPTSLSFALLLLLLWNPYAAASVSLQLSFAAVAGILLVSGPVMKRLKPLYAHLRRRGWQRFPRGVCRFLCGVFSATLGAMLFTAPLSALYFGSMSLAGVLANLLALWAVFGLFAFGLPAALAGLLSPAAGAVLGWPALICARWTLRVAAALGGLSFAALPLDFPYYRLWLGAVYVLLGVCFLLRRQKPSPLFPLCGGVLLLLAAIGLTQADYAGHDLTLAALDVGQGSSTAFLSEGRAVLVDCGGNGLQNAGDTAADWFQALGVSKLDLLILTHFDADHFNGVEELFSRMEIGAVVIPLLEDDPGGRRSALCAWAAAEGAGVTAVSKLSQAEAGGAVFTLYPPLGSGTTNEEGLCVLCSLGEFDVLITGDADASVEAMLTKYFELPDVELLVAGHHGSKHSTSADFLAAVAPDAAIISSGENSFGHPDPETLRRLDAAGTAVFRTDTQGTVTVTVDGAH